MWDNSDTANIIDIVRNDVAMFWEYTPLPGHLPFLKNELARAHVINFILDESKNLKKKKKGKKKGEISQSE